MKELDKIVENYLGHVTADYVGLWQIASHIRYDLGVHDNREVKEKTLLVVRGLLEHGLRPGDYVHPAFKFWKEHDADSIIARIDREWDPRRGDPNLEIPICWFDALPGTKAYADHGFRRP